MRSIVRPHLLACRGLLALALPLAACVRDVPVAPHHATDAAPTDAGRAWVPWQTGDAVDAGATPRQPSSADAATTPVRDGSSVSLPGDGTGAGCLMHAPLEGGAGTTAFWPTTGGSTSPHRPLSGGTLAVSADDSLVIAADADRDQVWFVDARTFRVSSLALTAGDEPGRIAEDSAQHVHVVLRGAGAIADIDLRTRALIARRPVCAAPRGIAYDTTDDTLRVACLDGSLITLPAGGGTPTATVHLQDDLRDVLYDVTNRVLYVSRMRSATMLVVDPATGSVLGSQHPDRMSGMPHTVEPDVAWRTVQRPGGEVVMLHQYAATEAICPTPGGYGGGRAPIVVPAVTSLTPSRGSAPSPLTFDPPVATATAIDVAVAGRTGPIAVAIAGTLAGSENPSVLQIGGGATARYRLPAGQAIAVAYTSRGALIAQTRDPAILYFDVAGVPTAVDLGAPIPHDPGHQIFHTATAGGLSCAGCHPEGGDDGHVWNFAGMGARRTQNLRGGLAGTAPFHWDGAFTDVPALLEDVLHGRMSGPALSGDQTAAVQRWIDTIPPVQHAAPTNPSAVARGQVLFNDPALLCVTCHSGPRFTNNATVAVGTGGNFQVPSLTGLAFRAPYMHDGCAPTLRDRFTNTVCGGGDLHGHTSGLTPAQIDDLVAYLATL